MILVSVTYLARGIQTSLTEKTVVGGSGEVSTASIEDVVCSSVIGFVCCCSYEWMVVASAETELVKLMFDLVGMR